MNSIFRLVFFISLIALIASCKAEGENQSGSKADASQTTQQTGSGPATKSLKRPKKQKPTMSDKTSANSSRTIEMNNADATSKGASTIGVTSPRPVVGKHEFWNHRTIRFFDYVGNTGDLVYEQIQGMKYFANTRIFVYATDKTMEGTLEYSKVENLMKSTRLDDRIFIWAHFDEDHSLIFLKTLISENIKDILDEAKQEF